MSELHRTLEEDIMYPPHDPRKASAEYKVTHHHLVYELDSPCWICGVRESTRTANGVGPLETHHAEMEWAAANGVDLGAVMADFPALTDHAAVVAWLDSEGNMLILCPAHHRGLRTGIHSITYPAWKLQRWQAKGGWTFIQQPQPKV